MKYKLSALALLVVGSATAATMSNVNLVSSANYKDSFSFSHGGKYYMAVSNGGKLRILKGNNNGTSDSYTSNTVFCDIPINDAWAPQIFMVGTTAQIFYTSFNGSLKTYRASMNMSSVNGSGKCSSPPTSGSLIKSGLYDPTVWYDNGKYYMAGTSCTNGSTTSCMRWVNDNGVNRHVWDSYLVWSSSTSLTSGWSTPKPLLDDGYNKVDKGRDSDIGYLVEAPIWSAWDHPNSISGQTDGKHELYWSIGPSDPYLNGNCNMDIKAVRRGDIWYRTNGEPYIKVWGPQGGNDDLMAANRDCYHATHPDFQANGDLRVTTMSNKKFYIGNYTRSPGAGGWDLGW